ncbi:unnamed protein product [Dicrocoelium dendriticum]|nr:unnamed protein product [Dicrocoelium dendriticum]
MGEDTIVLSAENCSFTVPRSILAEHSVYFAAALESEMLEFATGHFVFPDFTASQLSLFVQCAQSGFTHWPENECESSMVSDRVQCDVFLSNLSEVLELDCVADYLQISSLTDMCAARLSKLLAHVFDSYATSCEKHQSPVFEKFLYLWATFEKRLTRKLNDILFRFTARNPVSVLTSFPSPPDASLGSTVIELVVSVLTSDTLCVSDEDQVLEIALNWIRLLTPSGDRSSELVIVRSFLNCVRLGLLSPSGRSDMAQFWSIFYPEFKWQDQLTYDEFVSVLRSDVCKVNHAPGAAIQPCCCPRASTPCLLTILPNCNGAGLELWAFNLLTGEHRVFSLTEHLLCYLSHDFPPAYNDDIHIYLCHSSVAVPDSSVVFLIYHPYQHGGSLIGFVWCLSTGKVQWIPRLPIHPDDRTTPGVPHSARTSSSRRFDLVTLRTGLLVYFLAPVHSWVLIFAFTFDFASWTWHTLPPTTVIWYPVGASVRSTPIKQLSSITHDGWVYAHVEVDEQSIARALPISRHNLHQLSLHRSVLCRFRPLAYTEQETCRFELEILPPAPFLVRIYRLLVLNAADHEHGHLVLPVLFCVGLLMHHSEHLDKCMLTDQEKIKSVHCYPPQLYPEHILLCAMELEVPH